MSELLIVEFQQIRASSWGSCSGNGDADDASGRGSRLSAGLYREHYNGITQMHWAVVQKWHALVRPPAPAPLLQIAAAAGYSGRGRRPAAATPSARLFSGHYLQYTHFLRTNIEDVNVRLVSFYL